MKRVLRRSTMIFILTLAFIVGMGFFCFELITEAGDWANQPYNAHVAGNSGLSQAGTIYDRNGEVLAQSVDDKRVYNDDASVRTSLLHVVGDNSLNISTAIQSQFRSQLTGYNLIWGLNMPESLRVSHDMKLTVDAQTCANTYNEILKYGQKGACMVYNYKTGEIICSVSARSYDPADPPEITEDNESEYDGVYLNNVLSSAYTPGSTFKIVTLAAAIESISNWDSLEYTCNGTEEIGGNTVTCTGTHGTIGYKEAMSHSCNIYFAKLALEVGSENMTAVANNLGVNKSFEVDGIKTAKGNYNVSNADQNQLAWSGIGQYEDLTNPMYMAMLCGSVANGGKAANPTFIKDGDGDLLKSMGLKTTSGSQELMNSNTASKIAEAMEYTVSSNYVSYLDFSGLTVGAKTGSAEADGDKSQIGWIVGYSKDDDCPLAFACVVEQNERSQYGRETAGKVAEVAMKYASAAVRKKG